jgi:sec-independent protein translocase protein TatB
MFDISWSEFMLVGVVALIVIGPKELPGVLRTLGQYTRKVRSMAADFQNQFQEAMREAEMADLKKQVDDLAKDVKDFDPLKGVREDVEAAGRDIESSFQPPTDVKPVLPAAGEAASVTDAATVVSVAAEPAAAEPATPVVPVERGQLENVGADAAPTQPAAGTAPAESTERPA